MSSNLASSAEKLLATGLAAIAVVAACGGADEGDLLGASGASGARGDATAGTSGGPGGSAGAGAVGGTGGTAAAGGGGGSSGTGVAGAAVEDGGAGASTDGASTDGAAGGSGGAGGGAGASGGGPTVGVSCGTEICAEPCCVSESHGLYCVDSAARISCECQGIVCSRLEVECDGPEDCPAGEVCCLDDGVTDLRVRCESSCTNDIVDDRDPMCHPGDACGAAGEQCLPEQRLPPGWFTCNPP